MNRQQMTQRAKQSMKREAVQKIPEIKTPYGRKAASHHVNNADGAMSSMTVCLRGREGERCREEQSIK